MSEFTFIVNPRAAKGAAAGIAGRLKNELGSRGAAVEILTTERPGHATELARASTAKVVVSVGGDGTINEVANGVLGSGKTLGVIPAGSGNDLIKSLNIPVEVNAALDVVFRGKVRTIDVGHVHCVPDGKPRDVVAQNSGRYFVNGVGIGFDAAVAARTAEIPYLRGVALYIAAVFQTLGKYRPPEFQVSFDGGGRRFYGLLIAVGNGRCAGGGFYLTPKALPDDGLLDICMVNAVSLLKILRLMPRVMKGGHEGHRDVEFARTKKLTVGGSAPFYVHADGEIVGRDVTGVAIELAESRLPVLVGS